MIIALTRAVPPSIVHCELSHLARTPIDVERATLQHREYELALECHGCRVERIAPFRRYRLIAVDPSEEFAANALRLGDGVLYPSEFPRTRERLERAGIQVYSVPAGELAKAEGGVTCCSVIVHV
jgi:N-dimethylarginine dimethylaminohydrolase